MILEVKMEFLEAFEQETNNTTVTQNGAKTLKSSTDTLVDLFSTISSSRTNPNIVNLFIQACEQDLESAVRILFNSRDIRGGQGERTVFRNLLKSLALSHPKLIANLIQLVPEYGRWDDLWVLLDTELKDSVLNSAATQMQKDLDSDNPSLLAKWMPSCNASSKITKRQAKYFMKYLGMKEKEYRLMLSNLRNKIDIVEKKICSKQFKNIEYSKLPSRAGLVHRKTFLKHDSERYVNFMSSLNVLYSASINAATLYPYDVVKPILADSQDSFGELYDAMWKNLPDYFNGESFNGLVVADVSGSMSCNDKLPLSVSISLAMYISERNNNGWKDKFITFSENPTMQTVSGENVVEKVNNLKSSDWGYNTDLMLVFSLILEVAVNNNIAADDMPESLFIISDMEFDIACKSNKRTNFEQIEKKYAKSGYKRPNLVFWNVNASGGKMPVKFDENGTCLVSGCSPSVLKAILGKEEYNPISVMNETILSERYDPVGDIVKDYLLT
jgi:hypothetical protein